MPNEQLTPSDLDEQLRSLLSDADEAFIVQCSDRMELGKEKYGPAKFLGVDTLQEAMDEVIDLANYARMTFVKLYLLQGSIQKIVSKHPAADTEGFVSTKEMMGND